MADERVRQTLVLLEEAGRMDPVRTEVLSQMRLPRKAADGIAAAMWACSPPRCEKARLPQARRLAGGTKGGKKGGARDRVLGPPLGMRHVEAVGGAR
ncbi:hypothetical protein NDU88_007436 [Pleurodeles waltl]|uniref:Uncharacterized protein n=1 Tax=Pleurodeles waltl TaxID=8319 RepID=A0AAV7TZU0_PLEWA|nr:hypothetical protein NDU88_007436 [Pleurodeles waltl]